MSIRRIALLVTLPMVACGGGPQLGDDTGTTGGLTASCDDGAPVDAYVAGLERVSTGGTFTLVMLEANPAPPDVGMNTFTVSLGDTSGPIVGGGLSFRPWMPLHGHGAAPELYDGADDGSGTYVLGPMDLFMPGLWELQVTIESDGASDEALFRFCLEG